MNSGKRLFSQPEQIAYCLGASNYTWIHFRDGKKELVSKSISRLEARLPGFIRVHKTVLVNTRCIKSAYQLPGKKGAGEIHLASGDVFPVSRRRWADLAPHLCNLTPETDATSQVEIPQVPLPEPPAVVSETAAPSILLVTDDPEKTDRAQRLMHKKWTGYDLQTIQSRLSLATLQSTLSTPVSPTLILLDAQTQKVERMNMLRSLKETGSLRHIPVIVFVLPGDQFVIDGYHYQANSVIALPKEGLLFEEHLKRVLHFWLDFVALPSAPVVC